MERTCCGPRLWRAKTSRAACSRAARVPKGAAGVMSRRHGRPSIVRGLSLALYVGRESHPNRPAAARTTASTAAAAAAQRNSVEDHPLKRRACLEHAHRPWMSAAIADPRTAGSDLLPIVPPERYISWNSSACIVFSLVVA